MKKLIGTIATAAILMGLPPANAINPAQWLQAQVDTVSPPTIENDPQPQPRRSTGGGTTGGGSQRRTPTPSGGRGRPQPPQPQNRGTSGSVRRQYPPSSSKVREQEDTRMAQLLERWGFAVTDCQGEVAEVRNIATGGSACVEPDDRIYPGYYVYDPKLARIRYYDRVIITRGSNGETIRYRNPVPLVRDYRVDDTIYYFDNAQEYGVCLDAILLAYEGRDYELRRLQDADGQNNDCVDNLVDTFGTNISKDLALLLIDRANYVAVAEPNRIAYPTLGLRQRIAKDLGYIYLVDDENPEVLQYLRRASR